MSLSTDSARGNSSSIVSYANNWCGGWNVGTDKKDAYVERGEEMYIQKTREKERERERFGEEEEEMYIQRKKKRNKQKQKQRRHGSVLNHAPFLSLSLSHTHTHTLTRAHTHGSAQA